MLAEGYPEICDAAFLSGLQQRDVIQSEDFLASQSSAFTLPLKRTPSKSVGLLHSCHTDGRHHLPLSSSIHPRYRDTNGERKDVRVMGVASCSIMFSDFLSQSTYQTPCLLVCKSSTSHLYCITSTICLTHSTISVG